MVTAFMPTIESASIPLPSIDRPAGLAWLVEPASTARPEYAALLLEVAARPESARRAVFDAALTEAQGYVSPALSAALWRLLSFELASVGHLTAAESRVARRFGAGLRALADDTVAKLDALEDRGQAPRPTFARLLEAAERFADAAEPETER